MTNEYYEKSKNLVTQTSGCCYKMGNTIQLNIEVSEHFTSTYMASALMEQVCLSAGVDDSDLSKLLTTWINMPEVVRIDTRNISIYSNRAEYPSCSIRYLVTLDKADYQSIWSFSFHSTVTELSLNSMGFDDDCAEIRQKLQQTLDAYLLKRD